MGEKNQDVYVGRCRDCGAINSAVLRFSPEFVAEMVEDGLIVSREPGPVRLSDCVHASLARAESPRG